MYLGKHKDQSPFHESAERILLFLLLTIHPIRWLSYSHWETLVAKATLISIEAIRIGT